jgi:hypothetical protein
MQYFSEGRWTLFRWLKEECSRSIYRVDKVTLEKPGSAIIPDQTGQTYRNPVSFEARDVSTTVI